MKTILIKCDFCNVELNNRLKNIIVSDGYYILADSDGTTNPYFQEILCKNCYKKLKELKNEKQ
jgi:hypothetical protein